MHRIHRAGLLSLVLLFAGCASHERFPPTLSSTAAHDYHDVGMASFYSKWHAGRRTASGEKYDPNALTAAHRTLPFGTRVQVTNLDNGRSVIVRINDRGPTVHRRLIDLSRSAADRLDMVADGTAKVSIYSLN
ncbi:lipoprotein [Pseudomonas oryzihabitans]|uniref:septal ring lytic transglycosylase RlpA family protein n=1 Tax=Pseudomonas rhizoryzae TaxID=2571129 RepID=UPI0007372296|nr:septal ring lytic transglycosylase RlpA family protein [Pseudomonas rhizoryzae]KTS78000.1 lipoprotein [Pseudomonas psychrotolerans]KTS96790.1 lipoprotein [Pseudomonas psychrotolerans]KTT14268.1 lipoprotein [Pseudomonas psychrotolerans]KTT25082.1 lipoprotein [Pseudomonas psychrotolerans]KTT34972.1 lipoprotein [Pseudomonas psychrotolerans]